MSTRKATRRKWGSIKEAVAQRAHMPAPEIVRELGVSRYSVYYAARRQLIKLPSAWTAKRLNYANI